MSELRSVQYEPLLKDDLACWRCGREMKNIPALKAHLQEEVDKEAAREKARIDRKRKRATPDATASDDERPTTKVRDEPPERIDSGQSTSA